MITRIRAAAVAAIVGGAGARACVGGQDQSGPPATTSVTTTPAAKTTRPAKDDHDHKHEPGSHGGLIVSIGQDSYHAEAVFEKGGVLRLFMLGKDESKVMEVPLQT